MEFSLLWAALTAVAFGWLGLRIWNDRLPQNASDRLIGAALLGLVGGRLAAMLLQGVNPITHPADIIIVRGGVSTVAATIVFVATLIWSTRRTPVAVDAMAPAVLLALAGWHAGCLWRNACLGAASDLPWAWALPGSTVTRHPVELYAAMALALGAFLMSRLDWRFWLRAGTALIVASTARLATEPLRPALGDAALVWYVVGVGVGAAMILLGPSLRWSVSSADD